MIEHGSRKNTPIDKYPLSAEERKRGVRSAYRCWLCGKPMPNYDIRIVLPWTLNAAGGHDSMTMCEEHKNMAEAYYQHWRQTLRGRLIQLIEKDGGENK